MPAQHDKKKSIEEFFKKYPVIKFETGERIIRPWELQDSVMLIRSGYLKAYSISRSVKEVVIGYMNADKGGIIIGTSHDLNKYYIEALTPVEVWKAPKGEFFAYVEKNPLVYEGLTFALLDMLKQLYDQIELLKLGDAYKKIASVLYHLAIQFGIRRGNKAIINLKLTHKDLASLAGVTRETATAQINKLKKKGIIKHKDSKVSIANLNLLMDEADINEPNYQPGRIT